MLKIIVALLMMLPSITYSGEPYVCSGGNPYRTYHKVCTNIVDYIPNGSVLTSLGSVQNIDRIFRGEADVIVVQYDAIVDYFLAYPEGEDTVESIGSVYDECAHLVVNKRGKVRSVKDLEIEGKRIAVGLEGSGTLLSWTYMRSLVEPYEDAEMVKIDQMDALTSLSGNTGEVDAVLFITKPTYEGTLTRLIEEDVNLEIVDFNNPLLYNVINKKGVSVYHKQDIKVNRGILGSGLMSTVETACVPAMIVVRKDRPKLIENLRKLMRGYRYFLSQ